MNHTSTVASTFSCVNIPIHWAKVLALCTPAQTIQLFGKPTQFARQHFFGLQSKNSFQSELFFWFNNILSKNNNELVGLVNTIPEGKRLN